jgi:hypothetical protein
MSDIFEKKKWGDPRKKPKTCAFCDYLKFRNDYKHECIKTGLVVSQTYVYRGFQNPTCTIKDQQ